MITVVDGVTIQLTPEQIAFIQKEKQNRLYNFKSFLEVFKTFGFTNAGDDKSFLHEKNGWYAEIMTTSPRQYVWMVGNRLKNDAGFPGGHTYDSPEAVARELMNVSNQ